MATVGPGQSLKSLASFGITAYSFLGVQKISLSDYNFYLLSSAFVKICRSRKLIIGHCEPVRCRTSFPYQHIV